METTKWRGRPVTVLKWEPLSTSMNDVLLSDGESEFWASSRELVPFIDRWDEIRKAEERSLANLQAIRARFIEKDQHERWHGMEFGKGHFLQMLDDAINAVERRLNANQ